MSNQIFPQLAGLNLERTKTPEWKTVVHQSVNGKESRTAMMSFPIWNFQLTYNTLRTTKNNNELSTVLGFYNQMQGSYDTFLYLDPDDSTATSQNIGIGNGTNKNFQLVRYMGNFIEPIQNPFNFTVYINGVSTTAYTITNGLITFTTAPTSGQVVSWSGSFYYRCRFTDDTQDYDQFLYNMYEVKKISLRSVKL